MDSVTPPDPTAVRRNAERIKNSQSFCYLDEDVLTKVNNAARTLADAYLALTDPTPLTVEVLVGMGFVVKSAKLQTWKRGTLNAMDQDGQFAFATDSMAHIWPRPRTAGELRQLLTRLEK